jgi:hypothetical protein
VPESSIEQQQQLVVYNYNYYAAATQHDDNPIIQKAAQEGFDEDKMERVPFTSNHSRSRQMV